MADEIGAFVPGPRVRIEGPSREALELVETA